MPRLYFITAGLTLVLGFIVEIVFCAVCNFFGDSKWLGQIFRGFHYPAASLISDWILVPENAWQEILSAFIFISVAVLQWWLIILAAIWSIRHFKRKSA